MVAKIGPLSKRRRRITAAEIKCTRKTAGQIIEKIQRMQRK
jgi:hypothetical protein